MELRPNQAQSIDQLVTSLKSGKRRPIVQGATGSGKTFIACEIIRRGLMKGSKIYFLTPRRQLVFQTVKALDKYGVTANIYMAGINFIPSQTMVASIDTIASRHKEKDLPKADIVIVDECHLYLSPRRQELLERWSETAIVIGLTATPALGSGKGLGAFFDDLLIGWSIEQLIQAGFLCQPKYYAPSTPDLAGIKVTAGDYNQKQLGETMDKPKLIGEIVHNWFRLASWKPTVVFCTNKAHSRHVCEEFLLSGVSAEHIDSDTPDDERADIFKRIESGETVVLCNVYIASYGIDIPKLEVAVIAKPTRSIVLYMQTIGRILRVFEGKEYAMIIDHSGCVQEHGFVENIKHWSLNPCLSMKDVLLKEKQEAKEPKEITCLECKHIFSGVRICPMCDFEMISPSQEIPVYKADLVEIEQPEWLLSKRWNRITKWEDKIQFYGELLHIQKTKGYKNGWASHQYKARAGVWANDPRLKRAELIKPTTLTTGWLKHLQIKRAYSK